MSYILGISCGYHDSAASLIKDGIVLGACEEEKFTGIKHDSSFPHNTIDWLFINVKPPEIREAFLLLEFFDFIERDVFHIYNEETI